MKGKKKGITKEIQLYDRIQQKTPDCRGKLQFL